MPNEIWLNHLNSRHGYRRITKAYIITDYSLEIKKLTVHANFTDLNRWLRDTFVTGLNRSHAAVQKKLSYITNLSFERAVEIAVNMTMVKENARQFHSPGGATVGTSSTENGNRVRLAPKQSVGGDILDR